MGRKQTTIQDIAKATGVSKTTISRYLNGKFEFMSEKTKNHIADIIAETGYRPNRMANSLKTNRSGLIGIVMSNVMSNQTPRLLGSICDTCAQYGKKIIVVNSEKNPEKERALVYDLLDQRVDGLLVVSGYNVDFYRELDREELPVVLADRVPKDTGMDIVAINHAESTSRVINHLLNQGFKHIVLLKHLHKNPNNTPALRAKAAIKTCRDYFGDDEHCESIILKNFNDPDEDAAQNFEELTDILKGYYNTGNNGKPTAIFVVEPSIMNATACSYYRAGLGISSRFTIAGYSEWNMGCMITPPISTIEQPLERMGQLATEKLIRRIDNQEAGEINEIREANYLSCRIHLADLPNEL
ncbi:MAG: LacI family DNA-binding transcriptional regulator [Lachnospiraceae bacterium]|nr:LacI family DNA-binding transcriptional regulator [Lachnospiraceae bacterium]